MNRRRIIILSILVFAGLSIAASLTSEGFLEADGCTHYLYARFALREPHYLVNVWGRPFCTALYALPAAIGERFGVRCMSLCIAIALSLVSFAIARQQRLREPIPTLALIFTLAQPLVFLHSFAELTELPFALLLGLAFLAYQKERWMYFALLCSILPLARPEGFGFLILAALALLHRGRWGWILVLPIAVLEWSAVGWILNGSPREYPWYLWLVHNWPYAEKSAYRSGSIFHFVLLMPAVISPLIFPALIVGIWQKFSRRASWLRDHRSRCALLIAVIPLMILIGHSVLYATGRMASSGEVRYMLIVAPFWAVLAAQGWHRMFAHRREVKLAALASLIPLLVNAFYPVLPLQSSDDWRRSRDAVAWMRSPAIHDSYPLVQAAHPWIVYFLGVSITDSNRVIDWRRELLDHPRDGVVLVWDSVYSMHNADTTRVVSQNELKRAGWVPITVPNLEGPLPDKSATWKFFLSPRDVNGKPTRWAASRPG